MMRKFNCASCKNDISIEEISESIQTFSNGNKVIRGKCMKCNRYALFVPYADSKIVKKLLDYAVEKNNIVDIYN